MKKSLSEEKLDIYRTQLRKLSNSAQYEKAYALSKSLMKKHPDIPLFAHYEADPTPLLVPLTSRSFTSQVQSV